MRHSFFLLFAFFVSLGCSAQTLKMRDVFVAMPDSVLLLVTENNRLDCIDFVDNNMEAKVRNRADEFVEMKKLTDDYLFFQTSESSRTEMKLLTVQDSVQVVCVVRTYLGPGADSDVAFYRADSWQSLERSVLSCLNGARPAVEDFFVDENGDDSKDNYIQMLRDFPLMEANLSADTLELTWTLGLSALSRDEKKAAQKIVQPIRQSLLR